MPQVKTAQTRTPNTFVWDTGQVLAFPNVASIGANVAPTTIQSAIVLPFACKINMVAASCTAINALGGSHAFNIGVGPAAYETAGAYAQQTATIANVPNHDGTVTTTINGTAVVYTEVGGDTTVTLLAGHVVTAINNNAVVGAAVPTGVTASNVAGVITLTANTPGTAGNAITLVTATTDSSSTYTRGGATLAGGTNPGAITLPPTDNSLTGPLPGGAGYPTVFAASGQALFSVDQALTATAGIGVAATTLQPALAAPTTSGGQWRFLPPVPDAVYPAGTLLTLNVATPPLTGSITNFSVSLGVFVVQPRPSPQQNATEYIVNPGTDF